ncbi:MAG TPA: hypothetical protein VM782_01125 [Stellaceae bacterium]|nr:hypothetical protein [Stellaceae bacterium]
MSAWRELSDEELFELDQDVQRRIAALQGQGVNVFGVDEHYLKTLIEEQMSERQLAAAREKHLLWLRDRLDEAEPQVRHARAAQILGVPQAPTNGGRG